VALVGLSFGAGIVQQVAIDHPDLVRVAIPMGTGARSVGWTWDYQMAEIEWRRSGHGFAGDRSSAVMAAMHYAAMYYPAKVLGDRELWPKLVRASAVEAVAERTDGAPHTPPGLEAVRAFLDEADAGAVHAKPALAGTRSVGHETASRVVIETQETTRQNAWLHRSYLKK